MTTRSVLTALLAAIALVGCETPSGTPRPKASPPTGKIIYQPHFIWADGQESSQGTGFFARVPDGAVLGITSAHFLEFDGPQLIEAQWLDVFDDREVGSFLSSRGKPGRKGTFEPMNTRSDYLIVIPTRPPPSEAVLEFDQRTEPAVGERIWLPDKDGRAAQGYRLVEGTVTRVKHEYVEVVMDKSIKPQSQSGSPFISQTTGKVLGSWAAGKLDGEKIYIYLTPAHAILNAAARASADHPLRDVIGKPTAKRE